MRIALVTETFPPEVNGVAHTLDRVVTELRTRSHQVVVVRPRQGADRDREPDASELLVRGLPLPGYPGLLFGTPAWRTLGKAFDGARPEVVHVATEGPLGLAALLLARRRGIPVISSFHTNFHSYGRYYGFGLLRGVAVRYLRAFHGATRATLVPCCEAAERLGALGFGHLRNMGRGVDTERFDPARRDLALRLRWRAGEHTPVVIYVGRLAAEKNLALAIRAFERMRVDAPSARFVLVGDGPLRQELERAHPGYTFCGVQRGTALAAHYASADVFLFPSLTETFGNVVLETMASGLAVVAFDRAAARDHIDHGRSGLKAPADRPDRFIAMAAGLAPSLERARALGAGARAACRDVSWKRVADRVESALRAATGPQDAWGREQTGNPAAAEG